MGEVIKGLARWDHQAASPSPLGVVASVVNILPLYAIKDGSHPSEHMGSWFTC